MTMEKNNRGVCTLCGHELLDEGFIEDMGEGTSGFARWIAGPLDRGRFGNARRRGRTRFIIAAFRCQLCGHLELFANDLY